MLTSSGGRANVAAGLMLVVAFIGLPVQARAAGEEVVSGKFFYGTNPDQGLNMSLQFDAQTLRSHPSWKGYKTMDVQNVKEAARQLGLPIPSADYDGDQISRSCFTYEGVATLRVVDAKKATDQDENSSWKAIHAAVNSVVSKNLRCTKGGTSDADSSERPRAVSEPHATQEQLQALDEQLRRQDEQAASASSRPDQPVGLDAAASTASLGSITCSSVAGMMVPCRVPQGARADFDQQLSKTPCIAGRNYRIDSDAVYVTGGCRASFRLSALEPHGEGSSGTATAARSVGSGKAMRVHYTQIFNVYADGTVSPRMPLRMGGVSFDGDVNGRVRMSRGVSYNGIDLAAMQGHDINVIQYPAFVEIVSFVP